MRAGPSAGPSTKGGPSGKSDSDLREVKTPPNARMSFGGRARVGISGHLSNQGSSSGLAPLKGFSGRSHGPASSGGRKHQETVRLERGNLISSAL